jgi:hypothetical protein
MKYIFVLILFNTFSKAETHIFSYQQNVHPQFNIEIYKDSTQKSTVYDVLEGKIDFKPNNTRNIWADNLDFLYWYKFELPENEREHIFVMESFFRHDEVVFYAIDSANNIKYEKKPIGFDFKDRSIKYRSQVQEIHFTSDIAYFLIKVKPHSHLPLAFVLYNADDFINRTILEYLYYGVFFGIMLVLCLYHLILFFTSKEFVYLFYSFYIIYFSLYGMVEWELMSTFFNYTFLDYHFYSIPFSLMTISLILYMYYFWVEKEKTYEKKLAWIFVFLVVSRVFLEILALFVNHIFSDSIIDFVYVFFLTFLGFYDVYKWKNRPSLFMLLAFVLILFAYASHARYIRDDWTIFDKRPFYLFNFTGLIFLAFAQALRYRTLKRAQNQAQIEIINQLKINEELKDKVNKELETLVAERTDVILKQAEEIARINDILIEKNDKLEEDVKTISKDRVMVKPLSFEDFKATYSSDEECYRFLEELKWSKGFKCRKCKHDTYSSGPILYSRRCNHCKYIETPTSHTVFHRLRFPIVKAFYIMFLMYTRKELTIDELSKLISLRAATCHSFKQKVLASMQKKRKSKNSIEGWSQYITE